ncbi:Tom22p NDAI_0F02930 [Naumovozyma dairenensis CBS 421]|uniref:Mitochondrial import receptor subunit TOM22 n=1 Tax=Naumovozyma dairenensis (strain ATCC 10597 / BCRC 20456 / CBS 421 / NBRC 0211 / NRRL Y-12639) TaxID=1071378 RepID=G0WCV0_NAUDC|nr:hypothetical protein NDAI_0F02930 [Naumovozyma dairenensis CBS 421]CCD25611.1 hypothetical protein NDAI_0F02930 [Naumovozyma dairenensis CBS 421]
MVELTEIKEENDVPTQTTQNGSIIDDAKPTEEQLKQENEEEEDDDSDFEDDFNENETFMERLYALKDIVPPKQRINICNAFNLTTSFIKTAFSKTGNITWILTTSALLLGVPLSLSILAEQQLIEMEKTFDLQKDANEILVGDSNAAPAK